MDAHFHSGVILSKNDVAATDRFRQIDHQL